MRCDRCGRDFDEAHLREIVVEEGYPFIVQEVCSTCYAVHRDPLQQAGDGV